MKVRLCNVFWGTHGCARFAGHNGLCYCNCCECPPGVSHLDECVAYSPYYGPQTRFYGEDAKARGLPLLEDVEWLENLRVPGNPPGVKVRLDAEGKGELTL